MTLRSLIMFGRVSPDAPDAESSFPPLVFTISFIASQTALSHTPPVFI